MPPAAELLRICNSMALQDPDLSIWKIYANTHTLPPHPQPTNIPELQRPFGQWYLLACFLHLNQSNRISIHWELVINKNPVCKLWYMRNGSGTRIRPRIRVPEAWQHLGEQQLHE